MPAVTTDRLTKTERAVIIVRIALVPPGHTLHILCIHTGYRHVIMVFILRVITALSALR